VGLVGISISKVRMRLFMIMTYDDYQYGNFPSVMYEVDHDDEDQEYCNWVREDNHQASNELTDKEILEDTTDQWQIVEIS
jgi:hypothetical protein